jgi:hypothetical protein
MNFKRIQVAHLWRKIGEAAMSRTLPAVNRNALDVY